MSDDDAFMALVLSNAQSELSALERGMHALQATEKGKHGKSVAWYAKEVGRDQPAVQRETYAAEVAHEVMSHGITSLADLDQYPRHLAEIHAAPEAAWPALVRHLLADKWTVKATQEAVRKVKSGEITQEDGADQIAVARSNPTLTGDALRTAQAEGGKRAKPGPGRGHKTLVGDPNKGFPKQANSGKDYWLRRLATLDADTGTDWLDRIERGELTANGAAKAADTMKSATPGPEREIGKGKAGPGRGKKTDSDTTRLSQGRGTDYLAARIKRDHPEIAALSAFVPDDRTLPRSARPQRQSHPQYIAAISMAYGMPLEAP